MRKRSARVPVDLSAIQNVGSCETIWNLLFDNPVGNIKTQNVVFRQKMFVFSVSWHAEVTGMHAACVIRGLYHQFDLTAK